MVTDVTVQLNDASHAWAAGFFDGEGCIYLKPFKNRSSAGGIRYQPKLVVGQTQVAPLDRLQLSTRAASVYAVKGGGTQTLPVNPCGLGN